MRQRRPFKVKKKRSGIKDERPVEDIIRELKDSGSQAGDYRRRSLEIHGPVCAKCGREFNHENLHLLTVHHRDGDHNHNPPDGSNWENLCIYCHDDEHSRDILADYLNKERKK